MVWVLMTALWVVMLLSPLALLFAFLPAGRCCPRCGEEALPIRSRTLALFGGLVRKRWCIGCGWDGVMRVELSIRPLPTIEVQVPDDEDDEEIDEPWRGSEDAR